MWADKELHGWGRYPRIEGRCARPERRAEALEAAREGLAEGALLGHGLGRSYGDAALLRGGRVILTRRLDRMLAFDPETGWLRCEAGVTIEDIIRTFVGRGWFPPVVPGTQFVTVGGALAADIHGKNHHQDGTWADHVRNVEILTGLGEIVVCDAGQEPELFWATVGGQGLTGLILSMEVQLYPIESQAIEMESVRINHLDEFFEVSAQSGDFTHTVTWIDSVSTGATMGRGILMRGRHAGRGAEAGADLIGAIAGAARGFANLKPFESNLLLNKATVLAFNEAYFRKTPAGVTRSVVGWMPFFFPLDVVQNWNYVYGSRGFLQYQPVVPPDPDNAAIREICDLIAGAGMASFLSVIKEFGDTVHPHLSFPRPGVTLALDLPNVGQPLLELLDRLDEIVIAAGGRIYLGKDARLSRESFRRMYPEWEAWKEIRDRFDPHGVFQSELGRRLGLVGGSR